MSGCLGTERIHSLTILAALALGLSQAAPTSATAQPAESWTIVPEPELSIGTTMGDDDHLFQSVQTAHRLPDGSILVADRGRSALRIYEADGTLRTEFGGSGEGPGEFQSIYGTWLTPDDRIVVWDAGTQRITTFSPDGDLLSTARVGSDTDGAPDRRGAPNLEAYLGSFADGSALVAALEARSRPGERSVEADRWSLLRLSTDGEVRSVVGELRGMRRFGFRPVPYGPVPKVAVDSATLYVSDGYEPEITVLDENGDTLRTIQVAAPEPSTDVMWSSLEEELGQRSGRSAELQLENLRRDRIPRSDRVPAFSDLLVDDRGLLWVKLYEVPDDAVGLRTKSALWPDPGGEWWVVRPSGELVASVRMPERVTPLEIRGDRLLGLSRDELGVERIVIHAIER